MSNMINGVDRDAIVATIAAIEADASVASFQFRLQNKWIGGGENRSVIRDFRGAGQEMQHEAPFVLIADEPQVLLSADRAPNPVEYVLHALAGCLTTSLAYHAAARGIEVEGIRTRFEADLDLRGFLGMSDVRRGFDGIRVLFEIDGDLDETQKAELMGLAQQYSPVFDMLSNGLPVQCSLAGSAPMRAAA
jgi:uncharacterized OsmC-like protein